MIELLHDLTKFRNRSLKPYFIDNKEPISNSPASIQVFLLEAFFIETVLEQYFKQKHL